MILITGSTGVLGSALMKRKGVFAHNGRLEDDYQPLTCKAAILCAGTKGYKECEGNTEAFRADVDGNIRLIRYLLSMGSFVVFVSSEGVEWGAHTAYARNRLLVEQTLWLREGTAVIRPGKFDKDTVSPVADLCMKVCREKLEGVHYWRPDERSV